MLEKNDLIICKNLDFTVDENSIFARVTAIDRLRNIIYLDRYKNYGKIHYDTKSNAKMRLSFIESKDGFYQKMSNKEILLFCRGLENITNNFQTNIEYEQTLDAVEHTVNLFYKR